MVLPGRSYADPFCVMRQQQKDPYKGNPYVRFMRRVEAGNRFFPFYKLDLRGDLNEKEEKGREEKH